MWGAFSSPNAARQRGGKIHSHKDLKRQFAGISLGIAALASRPVPITSCQSEQLITGIFGTAIPVVVSEHPGPQPPPEISHNGCAGVNCEVHQNCTQNVEIQGIQREAD